MTSCDAPWEVRQRAHYVNRIKSTRNNLTQRNLPKSTVARLEKRINDYEDLLKGVKILPEPLKYELALCLVCGKMKIMVEGKMCPDCRDKVARGRRATPQGLGDRIKQAFRL